MFKRIIAALLFLPLTFGAVHAQSGLLQQNQVWAGPTSGGQGYAKGRALVGADLPAPGASSLGGVQSLTCSTSNWFRTLSTSGILGCSQPAITDISGLGSGVATALAVAPGGAGSVVLNGGALGTPSSGVGTNLTGTAAGLTAGHVTTNANLTGDVTSSGNASTYNNVVPAAKGGAGTIAGALKGNGSGTVSQAALADLSNASGCTQGYTTGTWTPSDQSGASLTFTGVSAGYTQICNMVFAYASFSYPSTASGAAATIGGFPISFASPAYGRQCSLTVTQSTTAVHFLPSPSSTQGAFETSNLGSVTNAQMSTALVFFICVYPAA